MGLLLAIAIRFGIEAHWSILSVIIAVTAFVVFRLKVDILWVVVVGAVISALVL